MASSQDVTALLDEWSRGDRTALEQLLPLVYAELRRIASRQLRRERADLQLATDEVVIRKVGDDVILSPRPRDWKSYLESAPVASDAFMAGVEDLPVQERDR